MALYNTVLNNRFLDIAVLGTTTKTSTAQLAVTPSIGPGSGITSALLVNPAYSLSSGTVFGEQITPQFSPGAGNTHDAVYGLYVGQTITPAYSGLITNLIGLGISGPVVNSFTLTNSYSLFITNASGTVTNNYTAILGNSVGIPRVGVGTFSPAYPLDAAGTINTNRVYTGATSGNNQLFQLAQGYNQAGLCSGVVGTHKSMSQNTTNYFDTALLNSASKGFYGGVFDGRFIYCVPDNNSLSGLITRYDSVFSFSDPVSYTCFDTTAVSAGSLGFRGGVFDQRYVYFVPSAGTVTRYDTMSPFWSTCSYTCFDFTTLLGSRIGYQGAVYDGRYIYFVPNNEGAFFHGTAVRYDTTLSFTAAGSYTSFDMRQISPNGAGFTGGVYDGRYVYYVPYRTNNGFSGTALRYDTTLSFTATASYTCFDLTTVSSDCAGFHGAVFDGRFIYFAPYQNGTGYFGRIARYDTLFSFTSTGSYTTFDTTTVSSASRGFFGAVFDGRYIYFVPSYLGGSDYSGTVTRFDTTLSFFMTSSYRVFDTSAGNSQSKGFIGAVFDGRYIFLMPHGAASASGEITRLDTYPGEKATSMAVSQAPSGLAVGTYANLFAPPGGLIVSGNVGVNQTFANYELDVNGTINAVISVNVSSFFGFLGSTADNQHINVSQGYVQGGFGSGSAGTNKTPSLNTTEFYDLTQGGTLPLAGYAGGVFDGRYIYFVPYLNNGNSNGTVVRYDTLFPFNVPLSYRSFNLTQLNASAVQFVGGLYDGRYIYFIPYGLSFNHNFVQYDTTLSFTALGSYSIFDVSVFGITSLQGFGGGAFDGRYIYLAPTWNGGVGGQLINTTIVRYDSTLPFIALSSYSTFNTGTIDPAQTSFFGATFDGRYIYFIPYIAQNVPSGSVTRYDTTLPFSRPASYSIFNLMAINSICKQYYGGGYSMGGMSIISRIPSIN